MKLVQIVPNESVDGTLKSQLKAKERELRGKPTAFIRRKEGRWVHIKYPGWITWSETLGGVLVAEVKTKKPELEWQLLQAFVGYLDRHLGSSIGSISITYR